MVDLPVFFPAIGRLLPLGCTHLCRTGGRWSAATVLVDGQPWGCHDRAEVGPVISVAMLGGQSGNPAAVAGYYLQPSGGCPSRYYSEHDQVPGQWLGDGAAALGLNGPVDETGAARLLALLNAVGPDGAALTRPVWRADPAGRLPAGPLIDAVQAAADLAGVDPCALFTDPHDRARWDALLSRGARTAAHRITDPDAPSGLASSASAPGVRSATAATAGLSPLATTAGTGAHRLATMVTSGPSPLATTDAAGRSPLATTADAPGVDAALLGGLAAAAGLDPIAVFRTSQGCDTFSPALAKAGGRVDIRRFAIDVTVSAPKSVSVLCGLADPQTAAVVQACHERAVGQALGYLQRHAGEAMRGHHGDGQQLTRVPTDGWIAAGFTHHNSRADDPQLHTHLVVPNLLRGQDQRWSAIDSRAVFRHAKTAGYLYQAALRCALSQELGVQWSEPTKGVAEILGIPAAVLREFSQRRQQIEADLSRSGRTGRRAAQAACLRTRPRKGQHAPGALRASWVARLEQLGSDPTGLLRAALPRRRHRLLGRSDDRLATGSQPKLLHSGAAQDPLATGWVDRVAVAVALFGPRGVTEQRTGFDRRDALQALAVTLPVTQTGNAAGLERLVDELLTDPAAVSLQPGADGDDRWSTADLLSFERRALTLATAPAYLAGPPAELLERLLSIRPWLSVEQQDALRQVMTAPGLVSVLVGPAGSGKTAVLATARELLASNGNRVFGCALAALTAQRLEQASGIRSFSLAELLLRLEPDGRNPRHAPLLTAGSWVVLDEAAMVGTRQLTRLLEHVHTAGGRVLLVGDPAQLSEIDAGGLFRYLAQPSQRPATLGGNQRQHHPWEITALGQLRTGQIATALGAYADQHRITVSDTREHCHDQITADYLHLTADATTPAAMRETIVLATLRVDVHDLNSQIRRGLQQAGRLAPDALTLELPEGQAGFTAGDHVIVTRTCRQPDGTRLLNGTRGQLDRASSHQLCLRTEDGTEHTLTPATAVESLRHGYALTIHKAQGLTATTSLTVTDGLNRNAAYTALSRGREHNQLYAHHDPDAATDDQPAVLAQLREQLSRPTGDTLASLQRPRLTRPPERPALPTPAGMSRDL